MSTSKKRLIADAGIEHDTPDYVPARRDDPSTAGSAADVETTNAENEREIPPDVIPDWEEL